MSIDPVTAALLKEFSAAHNLNSHADEERFEHFVNYLAVSDIFSGEFSSVDVSTGQTEFGLDGIAIVVNDVFIEDSDQLDDIISKSKYLECEFLFIQSETSNNFDSGEILKTLSAVTDFFADTIKLVQGVEIAQKFELKKPHL